MPTLHAALHMPRCTCRTSQAAPASCAHGPLCAVTRPPLTRQPYIPAPRAAQRRACLRVGVSAGGHAASVFRLPPCSPPLFRPAPKPRRTPYPLPRNTKAIPRSALHVSRPCFPLEIFTICIFSEIYYILSIKGAVSDRDGSFSTRPTAPAGRRTEHRRPGRTGPALRSQSPRAVPVYSAGASRLHW